MKQNKTFQATPSRYTAIAAGYSTTAFLRLTAREQSILALSQIRNDADAGEYRTWRRVGGALQLAMYAPKIALFVVLFAYPSLVGLFVLITLVAGEIAMQRLRRQKARKVIARLEHPSGKRRRA